MNWFFFWLLFSFFFQLTGRCRSVRLRLPLAIFSGLQRPDGGSLGRRIYPRITGSILLAMLASVVRRLGIDRRSGRQWFLPLVRAEKVVVRTPHTAHALGRAGALGAGRLASSSFFPLALLWGVGIGGGGEFVVVVVVVVVGIIIIAVVSVPMRGVPAQSLAADLLRPSLDIRKDFLLLFARCTTEK